MKAVKRVPKHWPDPEEDRCVYEKRVNNGPVKRCRFRQKEGEIGIMTVRGYCGIHLRMMQKRQEAKIAGRPYHGFTVW